MNWCKITVDSDWLQLQNINCTKDPKRLARAKQRDYRAFLYKQQQNSNAELPIYVAISYCKE